MSRARRLPSDVGVRIAAALAAGLLVLSGCGGDDGDGDASPEAGDTTAEETTPPADEPLRILVSNDDGMHSPGLDTVVEGLHTLDDVEIHVVAPVDDQSGSGDTVSDEVPEANRTETLGGRDAVAVNGEPADTVVWAHEEIFDGEDPPHLTVSGANHGQNIGWLAYVSGTVGVARESTRHGVPGLAVSQERSGDSPGDADYDAAVPFVLDWVAEHRTDLLAGDMPLDTVASLNVPTCQEGEVRGLFETDRDPRGQGEDGIDVFAPTDCTSNAAPDGLDDVEAFQIGYATLTAVAVEEGDAGDPGDGDQSDGGGGPEGGDEGGGPESGSDDSSPDDEERSP